MDIALAEFNSLRAEITTRLANLLPLLAASLTASAALGGFAIGDGPIELVLLVPLICAGLGIVWLDQLRQIGLLGAYISHKLWPFLTEQLPPEEQGSLPSWERAWESYNQCTDEQRKASLGYLGYRTTAWGGHFAGFIVPSVTAVIAVAVTDFPADGFVVLWSMGAIMTISFGILAVYYRRYFRPRRADLVGTTDDR